MPYRMCKASAILALRVACKVHDPHNHIQKDKYAFEERIGTLVIDGDQRFNGLLKTSNLLRENGDEVEVCVYLHLLDENVQLLTQGITERDVTFSSSRKVLFNTQTNLANMSRDLDFYHNMLRELKAP